MDEKINETISDVFHFLIYSLYNFGRLEAYSKNSLSLFCVAVAAYFYVEILSLTYYESPFVYLNQNFGLQEIFFLHF